MQDWRMLLFQVRKGFSKAGTEAQGDFTLRPRDDECRMIVYDMQQKDAGLTYEIAEEGLRMR